MTYLLTCKQIDSGVGDIAETLTNINVEDFAKKSEVATKEDLNTLSGIVANKLDSSPIHHHDIADIDQLATVLGDKLDRTQTYNYSSILSNPEEINYLNQLKTPSIILSPCKQLSLYSFELDSNNNLKILYVGSNPSITIASYNLSSAAWVFGSYNIGEVLQNHHDAIELLSNNQVAPGASSLSVSSTALTCSKKLIVNDNSGHCVSMLSDANSTNFHMGNSESTNNCAVLRFIKNESPKYLGLGFFNNDDKMKIDTNGNVNITGNISSPTITDIYNKINAIIDFIRIGHVLLTNTSDNNAYMENIISTLGVKSMNHIEVVNVKFSDGTQEDMLMW